MLLKCMLTQARAVFPRRSLLSKEHGDDVVLYRLDKCNRDGRNPHLIKTQRIELMKFNCYYNVMKLARTLVKISLDEC